MEGDRAVKNYVKKNIKKFQNLGKITKKSFKMLKITCENNFNLFIGKRREIGYSSKKYAVSIKHCD